MGGASGVVGSGGVVSRRRGVIITTTTTAVNKGPLAVENTQAFACKEIKETAGEIEASIGASRTLIGLAT